MLIATTERLRIRDWQIDDAPAALDIMSRLEVVRWLGDGEPVLMKDLDEARTRIGTWMLRDDPPCGHWAIEVTDGGPLDGRTIGTVLLVPLPNGDGEVEIGWHLHPDAWGHGYASEAARAVLRRGFKGGLTEIHAVTDLTNEPSQAVCRRIGMEHRGIIDKWYATPSQYFVITGEQASAGGNLD
ncbi:MAG: putative acetyltransferase [Marmoricola sp.]|nr:putative acetyltransferase [Marmoricola sp.]